MMTPERRAQLRAHLIASGIAGDTKTTRENTVRNAHLLAEGDPDKFLGLDHLGLDVEEVMRAVAELCGCDPDPNATHGPGYIDPDITLDALDAYAHRVADAARRTQALLICTGHPTGPLPVYTAMARAFEARGCKVLRPLDDVKLPAPLGDPRRHRGNRVRFVDGVGLYADGASLYHTHASWPMERLLDACDPDLVLADHGFAGAAIARSVETLAFNDINDPSLAVARHRRMTDVVVPLDDNVAADLYAPLGAFLVEAIEKA
jgi:Phosphatase